MVYENNDEQSNNQYSESLLEVIYEDANQSFKLLRDDINSINTRLTLLIGFNATFASLLPKLPIQKNFFIKYQPSQEFAYLYPYAEAFLKIPIVIINWLLSSTKPLIALFVAFSVAVAILSVLPSTTPIVLLPENMLNKSKDCSLEALRIGIIKNRHETIERLEKLIAQKAAKLKYALIALGGAAILTVLDILTNVNI
jgi:hypothetical protein